MSNKLIGVYLVASLFLACDATHDVGEEESKAQQLEDAGPQEDGGTYAPCASISDCDPASEICDNGVCRPGCGSNYPGVVCGQGEACDDYICRPTCGAGCPSGTVCDPLSSICRPASCSEENPCPVRHGCADGTCVPIGYACSPQSPCPDTHACVQGFCQLWCGPNYPGHVCPSGQQCQRTATCG